MGSRCATGDHNPFQLVLLYEILDLRKVIYRANPPTFLSECDLVQGARVLHHTRNIHHSTDVGTAMTYKDSDPGAHPVTSVSSVSSVSFFILGATALRLAATAWVTDSEMSMGPIAPPQT